MGKNGSWFASVKKTLSPDSKNKSKKKPDGNETLTDSNSSSLRVTAAPSSVPLPEETGLLHHVENAQSKEPHSVTATGDVVSDESSVAAAQVATEAVPPGAVIRFPGKSEEEGAAIMIQTALRGYLARRAMRGLRGMARFRSLIEGSAAKRQTASTLRYLQMLSCIQSQVCSRRIRMLEEEQVLQKHAKELGKLQLSEEWDDSLQSREQVEAKLLSKYQAAMKRERALAYAFSHQPLKNSLKSSNTMFMDLSNPHWGWSWLERRMAARSWENRSVKEKELNVDHSSVKSIDHSHTGGEITRAYARHQLNSHSPTRSNQKPKKVPSHCSAAAVCSKPASCSGVVRKLVPSSPKGNLVGLDDTLNPKASTQPGQHRRHTNGGGSSIRDDDDDDKSQGGSPAIPSYMVPTKSAKAKSSERSLVAGLEKHESAEKAPAKKPLVFAASPSSTRRRSGPAMMRNSSCS